VRNSARGEDGVSEVFALITDLLDPDRAPAPDLAAYADRWRIEVLYDTVKVEIRAVRSVRRSRIRKRPGRSCGRCRQWQPVNGAGRKMSRRGTPIAPHAALALR
jgi:hypothetical protein